MTRKKNSLNALIRGIFGFVMVVGILAGLEKLLSPGQRCPKCDRILEVVNTIQSLCPNCGLLVTS